MSGRKTFKRHGESLAAEPYHYRACGLDDVYLLNSFEIKETEYGRGVFIHNLNDLHWVIGLSLVLQEAPLAPREFRFLRKEMGLTQAELASRLRVDVQTVARYEKGQSAIPWTTDRVFRLLSLIQLVPIEERPTVLETILEEFMDFAERNGPVAREERLRRQASIRNLRGKLHWEGDLEGRRLDR